MPSFIPFIVSHFFVKDFFFKYPFLYSVEEALYFQWQFHYCCELFFFQFFPHDTVRNSIKTVYFSKKALVEVKKTKISLRQKCGF